MEHLFADTADRRRVLIVESGIEHGERERELHAKRDDPRPLRNLWVNRSTSGMLPALLRCDALT
jgi:hypothetical protein